MAGQNEDKKAKLRRRGTLPESVQEYMGSSNDAPVKTEPKKQAAVSRPSLMDRLMDLPKWSYLVIAGVAIIIVFLAAVLPGLTPPKGVVYPENHEIDVPVVTAEPKPKETVVPLDPSQEDVVTVTVQGTTGDLPVIPGITIEQTEPVEGNPEELDLSDTDLQTVIVPATWAANITDEEINATVSVNGFADGQRLSDGSIRYIIGLKEYNAKRIELNTKLEDKIANYQIHSGDTYVKQIKVSHDKMTFSVYMKKMDDTKIKSVATDLLTAAKEYGLYATKSGVTPVADIYDTKDSVVRSFRVNKDGNILVFEPDSNGVMMPVQ